MKTKNPAIVGKRRVAAHARLATSRRSRNLRRGSEVLVQVIKEGIGTKGPTLSTYISIPGRYLVLMPGLSASASAAKSPTTRSAASSATVMLELNPPEGLGFIIRTAGIDRTKNDLQRDLNYLLRLWKVIVAGSRSFRRRSASTKKAT